MKVLGINGSHRAGKGTAALLGAALEAAAAAGADTELVELSKLDIGFCIGCNRCMAQTSCALTDDMDELYGKMRAADAILLASPDYFGTVSARTKNFMDRTRPFHMVENVLAGKLGGGLATAGGEKSGGGGAPGAVRPGGPPQPRLPIFPPTRLQMIIPPACRIPQIYLCIRIHP